MSVGALTYSEVFFYQFKIRFLAPVGKKGIDGIIQFLILRQKRYYLRIVVVKGVFLHFS